MLNDDLEQGTVEEQPVAHVDLLAGKQEPTPEEESFLPQDKVVPPVKAPANLDEQASQFALALRDNTPFEARFNKYREQVKGSGQMASWSDVLLAEHRDKVAAADNQMKVAINAFDAQRATLMANIRKELEDNKHATTDPMKNPYEANRTTVSRAVEEVVAGADAVRFYQNIGSLDRAIGEAADQTALRNELLNAAAKAREGASILEWAQYVAGGFLIFADDVSLSRKIEKVTGQFFPNVWEATVALRDYIQNLSPEARKSVLNSIINDEYGFTGDNKARKSVFLEAMAGLSREDYQANVALNLLGVGDFVALAKGIHLLAKKGVASRTLAGSAGPDAAGKIVADDLANGTKLSGLNDAELVSQAIAGGRNPFEVAPALTEKLSPAVQKQLRDNYNTLLRETLSKLDSSGMNPEEIQNAASQIRSMWMPDNNPRVAAVQWGEASSNGQEMLVALKRPNGTYYMTKEAAERAIKDEGLTNAVPVRARDLDAHLQTRVDNVVESTPFQKQIVFHGGHLFDEFDIARIGTGQGGSALGRGFSFSSKKELATKYAAKYGGSPTLYTVDIPDEAVANMLLWDKPLSQQPEAVRQAIQRLPRETREKITQPSMLSGYSVEPSGSAIYNRLSEYFAGGRKSDSFSNQANFGQRDASLELMDAGIPGIRYLDQGSRGAGSGTMNTVVFDENLIKILEENGMPVRGLLSD